MQRLRIAIEEYLRPLQLQRDIAVEALMKEPSVKEAIRLLGDVQSKLTDSLGLLSLYIRQPLVHMMFFNVSFFAS